MDRREMLWVVLFLILGGIGLASFLHFYGTAFPVASLDFKLSREEAFRKAQGYVEGLGYSTADYMSAQVFDHDEAQQIFLERTLGLKEANRLVRTWVSIWAWDVRWFKPLQKEELRVRLDPGGRIVRFEHSILEAAEGASRTQEAARSIAEGFLWETQGFDLDDYDLIERSSMERKARTDHTFTYRKKGFTVGEDGHYRLEVVVQGDRVGRFAEYLKVPESFTRHYREIRSRATLLSGVAMVFWVVLGVAMLIVLVRKYRQRTLRWQMGLMVGGLVLTASVVEQMNSLPLLRFGYVTTQSYPSFILIVLAFGVIGALFLGGIICLTGTAGGALGREVLSDGRRSPFGRLSLRSVRSGRFVRSTLVGYGLAFALLGYVTLFYIVGTRYFGVWSPAEMSDYDNAFSTAIPWIYPLVVGLTASTMEEFFFRLLAIPLLIQWFKRRWLAVLLPAMVWGFLHSNYPVEPIYTRGIEITAAGVVFGLVFLRYGIWASVIAHYVFDAFLVAFPMLKSSSLYFQISGIVVTGILLLPAAPALFGVLTGRHRKSEEEPEEEVLEPALKTRPPERPPQEAPLQKGPEAYLLDRRGRITAGALALVAVALLVGLRVEQFGERTLSLSVTRGEAIRLAEVFREEVGVELEGYRRTAWFQDGLGSPAYAHLIRKAGVARADTLATEETDPWTWYVRWFKPLEKEEVTVTVDVFRRIRRFEHRIPESRAGAELEIGAARPIAEAFVEKHFGKAVTDRVRYKLLEAQSQKRETRVDHRLVWERIDRKVEDGEFRLEATVQGDEVGSVQLHYKAPEAFLREFHKEKIKDVIPSVVGVVLVLTTMILGGIYFFRASREGGVTWGFPVRIGILSAALPLVSKVNELPTFFRDYDTSQALGTFLGMQALGLLLGIGFTGLAITVIVALAVPLFRTFHPNEMSPARWLGLLRLREGGVHLWWDTLLLGTALALMLGGIGQLERFVKYRWLTHYLNPARLSSPGLNTYLPFLKGVTDAASDVVALFFLVLAAFLIWQRALKRTWVFLSVVGVTAVLIGAVDPAEDLYHFAVLTGLTLISLAAVVFLVGWMVRFHLLAYMMALWLSLVRPGWFFLKATDRFYQFNGGVMLLMGVAPLVLLLIAYLKERRMSSRLEGS